MQDSPSGYWFFTPKKLLYGASVIRVCARFSFGLLVFTPKRITPDMWTFINPYFMEDNSSDYWSSPRSKERLYIEMTMPRSYGIIFGLRLWVCLPRVHRSVYPSSSSEDGSHRCVASEYHLEKWVQGSRSWTARNTLWSQFLIFHNRKRPSAQSAECIQSPIVWNAEGMESPSEWNAEGIESPFVRNPKARAYLCELKSRRSPKLSPFVWKAEGILVYLKNISLSNKNDAGIACV
jgi:hypothetical protein